MFGAEGDERTIAPTPRRLLEARRAGYAPRSRELTSAAAALAGVVALYCLGGTLWTHLRSLLETSWHVPVVRFADVDSPFELTPEIQRIALLLTAILVVPAVCSLIAAAAQAGFRLSIHVPRPDWSRISPLRGLGRLRAGCGPGPALWVSLKLLSAGLLTAWMLNRSSAVAAENTEPFASALGRLLLEFSLIAALLVGLQAIADWWLRRRRFLRSLRMTMAEARADAPKSPRRPRTSRRFRVSALGDLKTADSSLQLQPAPVGTADHLPSDPLIS